MGKILLMVSLTAVSIGSMGLVIGDDDGYGYRNWWGGARMDVPPVKNATYLEECGACHFAYQPGLLPADSWQTMMEGLDNHFGENAELGAKRQGEIAEYLAANAADRVDSRRSAGFAHNTGLRITDGPYFRRKHDEIPSRLVRDNPELGSFSRCEACHTAAAKGNFDEDAVRIPGVGRWDD